MAALVNARHEVPAVMLTSSQMQTVSTDFWRTLAYTLIGGTFGGAILTPGVFPAMYFIGFKIWAPPSQV